jgi:homoserine kinase
MLWARRMLELENKNLLLSGLPDCTLETKSSRRVLVISFRVKRHMFNCAFFHVKVFICYLTHYPWTLMAVTSKL